MTTYNGSSPSALAQTPVKVKKQSVFRESMKRLSKNKSAMIGLAVFILLVLISIFGPFIVPYKYDAIDPTSLYASPSAQHWFGCDKLGRDILSRMVYGSRYSLSLGVLAPVLSMVIGMVFGAVAGFFGQKADNIVMRFMDIVQSIPGILLSMVISTVLGAGYINTAIALAVSGIPMNCRLLRGSFLSIKNSEYIEAATATNCSKFHIITRHMIPNCFAPLLVGTTMGIGNTIITAAGLSFIGLGVQPPTPEWGAMLSEGRNYIMKYPHLVLFPGMAIALVTLALNMFGDGLRDAMDPKMKH